MSHKTTIIHSEVGNNFVLRIDDYPDKLEITTTIEEKEEKVFYIKKDGKITHTTGEK